jgi:hypothetical protein
VAIKEYHRANSTQKIKQKSKYKLDIQTTIRGRGRRGNGKKL